MTKSQTIMAQVRKAEDACRFAAYIIMKGGDHVGTVRIKYPKDGAMRLTVYVCDWAKEKPADVSFENFCRWQTSWANGYGYDKATAAMSGLTIADFTFANSGTDWDRQLRDAGFTTLRAI